MGNKQPEQLAYSFFGLLFGQMLQYKNFTKPVSQQIVKNVKSLNLSGHNYLITGASSGIGKELSKLLVQQGASIVMVSRRMENLDKAQLEICEDQSLNLNQQITKEVCDLGDLKDVDQLITRLRSSRFDGIINNGGILPTYQILKEYNSEQIEETVAVHVVAPYKLVYELKDCLNRQAIIINNTSAGLYSQMLNNDSILTYFNAACEDSENTKQEYVDNSHKKYKDGARVYAQCKRAMLIVSEFLAHDLNDKRVISVHPGWSETPGLKPLFEQHPKYQKVKFRKAIDSAYGILTILNANSLQNGGLYYDGEIQVKHRCMAGTQESQQQRDQLKQYIQQFVKI